MLWWAGLPISGPLDLSDCGLGNTQVVMQLAELGLLKISPRSDQSKRQSDCSFRSWR
jgi:hypothetical protein